MARREKVKKPRLTADEAKVMGEEYQRLYDDAQRQLIEHKLWLHLQIKDLSLELYGLTEEQRQQLLTEVNDLKLEMVRTEPAIDQGEKPTVSVVIEYGDALHAFLSRPEVGSNLNLAALGGITVDVDQAATTVQKVKN